MENFSIRPIMLKRDMPLPDALRAVDACETPMVSFPGRERMLWPHIQAFVEAMMFNTYASPTAAQQSDADFDKPHGPEAHVVKLDINVTVLREAHERQRNIQLAGAA